MILTNKISVPRTVNVASSTSAGATLITAPSSGKNVTLVDLINGDGSNMATLKEKHGSATADTIAQIPAGGAIALNAPILVSPKKVVLDAGESSAIASGLELETELLEAALKTGDAITFAGGGVFTLTSDAAAGANSIEGALTVAAVGLGEKGYTTVKVDVATSTKFTATYMVED